MSFNPTAVSKVGNGSLKGFLLCCLCGRGRDPRSVCDCSPGIDMNDLAAFTAHIQGCCLSGYFDGGNQCIESYFLSARK
jgi:ATP-dependent DNA ligase